MDISIITPIYNGNKYLRNYIEKINGACENKKDVEVIFVNDSPLIELELDTKSIRNFKYKIIHNMKNEGIQKSRINGLNEAIGKYIIFLDQDDEITKEALVTQFEMAEKTNADLIIGNGYFEDVNGLHLIYENKFSQNFSKRKKPYVKARDFIVSPGQCLIKKDSIPEEWKKNILKQNGTDDFLLWLLMFNKKRKVCCNYNLVYIHKYTKENLSSNLDKMYKSQIELLKILKNIDNYDKKDYKILERTIEYKHVYKQNFIKESIKNIDIFIYNIFYRSVWRGYVYKRQSYEK